MRSDLRRAVTGLALLVLLTLTACTGSSSSAPPAEAAPVIETYVALGDSFTAAPYVPDTSLAAGCFRSTGNYPARLAARIGAELRDVSCSAADTQDLTGRQVFGAGTFRSVVPPQLRAVRRGTDLVTVGIGGNDEGLFGSLVRGCSRASGGTGGSCADPVSALRAAGEITERTRVRVARVLRAVRRAAPEARVVLVGYPRLVDIDRGCRAMPLGSRARRLLAGVERRLNDALAAAAAASRATFLDLHPLSQGHEICSAEPWVNGRRTDEQRALSYHPFPEGQQAVADALLDLVASPPASDSSSAAP